jgi:hypothetical protein
MSAQTQTRIARKPVYNGMPYRFKKNIYRWSNCTQRGCSGHPIQMAWMPKEASLETKLKLFNGFIEQNSVALATFGLYPIPNDPLALYKRFSPELEAAFTLVKDTFDKEIRYYIKEVRLAGKHNSKNYLDRFLTGKAKDLVEAKKIVDLFDLSIKIFTITSITNPNNPNINYKRVIGLFKEHHQEQLNSYQVILDSYNALHSGKISQGTLDNCLRPFMLEDLVYEKDLELLEPVANHTVLFYTDSGVPITQEDLDNFDFNPNSDSEYEYGHEEYDW